MLLPIGRAALVVRRSDSNDAINRYRHAVHRMGLGLENVVAEFHRMTADMAGFMPQQND